MTAATTYGRREKRQSYARFILSAIFVLVLDQITKLAVMKHIPWEHGSPTYYFGGENEPITIIPDFLYIVHITNEGAAWGILSGQTYLLTSIAIMAIIGIWLFRSYLGFENKWGQFALGIFAGGVIGNLIDRVVYGHVVDFIDVHLPLVNYRWPAFNVADCGICIGVIIYIFIVMKTESGAAKK